MGDTIAKQVQDVLDADASSWRSIDFHSKAARITRVPGIVLTSPPISAQEETSLLQELKEKLEAKYRCSYYNCRLPIELEELIRYPTNSSDRTSILLLDGISAAFSPSSTKSPHTRRRRETLGVPTSPHHLLPSNAMVDNREDDHIEVTPLKQFTSVKISPNNSKCTIAQEVLDQLGKVVDTSKAPTQALNLLAQYMLARDASPQNWDLGELETEARKLTDLALHIQANQNSLDTFYGFDSLKEKVLIISPLREIGKSPLPPPKGMLLCGASGVGKTRLGKAIVDYLGFHCVYVTGSQVRSKIVGTSEKIIVNLFKQARSKSPSILFLDQIDALIATRGGADSSEGTGNRIVTTFLTEMDGIADYDETVFVIAVTSSPDTVDPAILRPGRIDEVINIGLPTLQDRKKILEGFLSKTPNTVTESQLSELSWASAGLTGASIENAIKEAVFESLNTDINASHVSKARFNLK
ncbi:hypothetical protein HDV05_005653 [Chytridiales sp. JEL 0842]|nr:hypothetical protein HDV05_005653 [Chytridiales sp. JEL 0842]